MIRGTNHQYRMHHIHIVHGGTWGLQIATTLSIILLCVSGYCQAASIDKNLEFAVHGDAESVLNNWPVAVIVVSVAAIVCAVLLIMGCADLCQKHAGFKDFDNDAFSTDDGLSPVPVPSSEFTMYPPVENTPDSVTPVVFEPLPDLPARAYFDQDSRRSGRTRPRVTQDIYERSDSVDSLDDVLHRDSVQDKIRLQNLLTNSRQQVPRGQLQYIKELGNGWFGKVLQGEGHNILPGHKKTKVVIQMLKEEPDTPDQMAFLEEVLPYRDTDHANVVKLLGQCVDTAPFLNILELCPFGDLKTYLRSHRVAMESFNEKGLLLKFACDMAAGLQALHHEGFIHRDFACRNCLLASDLSVKVGDYGVSEESFKEDYFVDGNGDALPIRWLAPECLTVTQEDIGLRRITKEANIWAYGVSMWEILTFGSMPYGDLTNNHVLRLVVLEKSVRLPKPDVTVSNLNRLFQLMQLCWSIPEDRPSLRELRIMLLHLLSRKEESDTSAFDIKWNQLMPRRSPRVTRVRGADGKFSPSPIHANGSIRTVTEGGPNLLQTSMPSVLSGDDDPTEVNTLNVSKLGLAGSRSSLNKFEEQVESSWAKPPQLTSPVNEKSLEAEFSAANVAAVSSVEVHVENSMPSRKAKTDDKSDQRLLSADEDLFSPIKNNDSVGPVSRHSPENTLDSPRSTAEDQVVPGTPKGRRQVPDGLVAGTPASSRPVTDFVTSTPIKKQEQNTQADSELYTTATEGIAIESSTEKSHQAGTFHTAHSYSSQGSIDRSLSVEFEDRSVMAPNKFADILKTVAMTPSVDDEMMDTSNENSPSVLDLSESDVFHSPVKNLSEFDHNEEFDTVSPLDGSIEGTLSGENTPRNTPTPPLATSAAPLLNISHQSLEESQSDSIPDNTENPDGAEVTLDEEDRETPTLPLSTSIVPLLDEAERSVKEEPMLDKPGEGGNSVPVTNTATLPVEPSQVSLENGVIECTESSAALVSEVEPLKNIPSPSRQQDVITDASPLSGGDSSSELSSDDD